ncbi:MAG: hypothetical protein R2882_03765 [Gemmatimonadales bacterium]
MYRYCLFCNVDLGRNETIEIFPVGRRLAFDPARGRLWVICSACHRWNLVPIEERWEAVEDCERLFRQTRLRYSTANIGLGVAPPDLGLVRIGPALKPEMAAWRYGRYLERWLPATGRVVVRRTADLVDRGVAAVAGRFGVRRQHDLGMWLRLHHRPGRIVSLVDTDGGPSAIRIRHLASAELKRPDPGEGWHLTVAHDRGTAVLTGQAGLSVAAKLFARLNGRGASDATIAYAVGKLDDAANPEGYFARVAAIALRCWWGKRPDAAVLPPGASELTSAERLALHLTKRSFWGRGGLGSEPATLLPLLPLVDRLALEMAANEDTERRVLDGELRLLELAWREAETLAAISDDLLLVAGAAA